MNEHLSETVWEHVLGLLGRTVTNVGHQDLALEAPSHSVVNTLGLAPVGLQERTREKVVG